MFFFKFYNLFLFAACFLFFFWRDCVCLFLMYGLKIAAIGGRGVLVTTKGCPQAGSHLLSSPPSDLKVDFTSRYGVWRYGAFFVNITTEVQAFIILILFSL